MEVNQIPLGLLQTNAYVLTHENGESLIIDPGSEGSSFVQRLKKMKSKPLAIILTHAHFDHIGAVDDVRDHFHIPVYVHQNEDQWLTDPSLNGSSHFQMPPIAVKRADHFIQKEQTMTIGPFTFAIFETPGHSPGSVSYYFKDDRIVFSGDALFRQSIGRTDLPFGNSATLMDSIRRKLLTLPDETIVAPGHGPSSSIGEEKNSNPFL